MAQTRRGRPKAKPKRGHLIVFEGPDGVGKSTLSRAIHDSLKDSGVNCRLLSLPGKEEGTLGELVYKIHHDPSLLGLGGLSAVARQALHVAAHLDAIERVILPALERGEHVLLDRYWWSTLVYGLASGLDRVMLDTLIEPERRLWPERPAVIFLIDRDSPIERDEDAGTWKEFRERYAELADEQKSVQRIERIRNVKGIDAATARILKLLPNGLRRSQLPERSRQRQAEDQLPMPFTPPAKSEIKISGPHVHTKLAPAKPTVVFDSYWRFAAERQDVFFRRIQGQRRPWTTDPIIETHKFTNAYRASDRVSQYLIRKVIYRDDLPSASDEVCFRILLFKLFNKIETWELLEKALGTVTFEEYSFKRYDTILSRALKEGQRIYSAAYIMPPGSKAFGHSAKHQNNLRLLELMIRDEVPARLAATRRMQDAFEMLRSYPTIGDFLAYQFVTDINYSEVTNFSEMEFVMPGPGALDGIRKCFSDLGGLNEPEIIRLVADIQADEFARLGLQFRSLFGRRLQLIDCQNLFCEVDKYARVAHPEFLGRTKRSRIKQKFSPISKPIMFWYPPKWDINDAVAAFSNDSSQTAA